MPSRLESFRLAITAARTKKVRRAMEKLKLNAGRLYDVGVFMQTDIGAAGVAGLVMAGSAAVSGVPVKVDPAAVKAAGAIVCAVLKAAGVDDMDEAEALELAEREDAAAEAAYGTKDMTVDTSKRDTTERDRIRAAQAEYIKQVNAEAGQTGASVQTGGGFLEWLKRLFLGAV